MKAHCRNTSSLETASTQSAPTLPHGPTHGRRRPDATGTGSMCLQRRRVTTNPGGPGFFHFEPRAVAVELFVARLVAGAVTRLVHLTHDISPTWNTQMHRHMHTGAYPHTDTRERENTRIPRYHTQSCKRHADMGAHPPTDTCSETLTRTLECYHLYCGASGLAIK